MLTKFTSRHHLFCSRETKTKRRKTRWRKPKQSQLSLLRGSDVQSLTVMYFVSEAAVWHSVVWLDPMRIPMKPRVLQANTPLARKSVTVDFGLGRWKYVITVGARCNNTSTRQHQNAYSCFLYTYKQLLHSTYIQLLYTNRINFQWIITSK